MLEYKRGKNSGPATAKKGAAANAKGRGKSNDPKSRDGSGKRTPSGKKRKDKKEEGKSNDARKSVKKVKIDEGQNVVNGKKTTPREGEKKEAGTPGKPKDNDGNTVETFTDSDQGIIDSDFKVTDDESLDKSRL